MVALVEDQLEADELESRFVSCVLRHRQLVVENHIRLQAEHCLDDHVLDSLQDMGAVYSFDVQYLK